MPQTSVFLARYFARVDAGEFPFERRILTMLRKRAVRSLSGVAIISFLTKAWGCPGQCVYCPTYARLPKSYVSGEPAVMRAERNDFDTVLQIQNRLGALETTGHVVDKCDVRVIGGTWSAYPADYRERVMTDLYDAHSAYRETRSRRLAEPTASGMPGAIRPADSLAAERSTDLARAQRRNETAGSRVIGVAVETRPDWVTPEEVRTLRRYGVTRVEIGYQTTHDSVNLLAKRGHGNAESVAATRLLKDAGIKVVAHMMPGLPGSTPDLDRESMRRIFEDPDFRPDELKLYPTVVTPHSELETIWRAGGYVPYDDATLVPLVADLVTAIPEYVRLNRLYRDIPAHEILAGSTLANLREHVDGVLAARGESVRDISAREIRDRPLDPARAVLDETAYDASGGREYFLRFVDPETRALWSLLRLRVPSQHFTGEAPLFAPLENAAIIREVHTFGDQLRIGERSDGNGQHMGFGRRLMERAEAIVRENHPALRRIAVTSGVGAREYYRKRGYALDGDYMVREI